MSTKNKIIFSTLILYLFFVGSPLYAKPVVKWTPSKISFEQMQGTQSSQVTSLKSLTDVHKAVAHVVPELQKWITYAKPVVEWTPSKISFEQMQGTQSSQVISVKFLKDVHRVVAHVVPELQKWITVSPSSIGDMVKGDIFDITITVNISPDDLTGTYDGVIQLKQLFARKVERKIAKPIPVVLMITQFEDPAVLLENISNDAGGLSSSVELPAVPDNETAKLSITGIDYNNNGIRDELENITFQGLNTLPNINIDSYYQLLSIVDMIQPKSPIVENSINEHNIYCSYRLLSEGVKIELPLSLLYSIVLDTQERKNAFNSSLEESVVSLGEESCE